MLWVWVGVSAPLRPHPPVLRRACVGVRSLKGKYLYCIIVQTLAPCAVATVRVQGWESVFWGGVVVSWESQRFKKCFARNTKIQHQSKISQKYRHFFKTILYSIRFTYVLRFLKSFRSPEFLKIPPPCFFSKTLGEATCLGFKNLICQTYQDSTPIQN